MAGTEAEQPKDREILYDSRAHRTPFEHMNEGGEVQFRSGRWIGVTFGVQQLEENPTILGVPDMLYRPVGVTEGILSAEQARQGRANRQEPPYWPPLFLAPRHVIASGMVFDVPLPDLDENGQARELTYYLSRGGQRVAPSAEELQYLQAIMFDDLIDADTTRLEEGVITVRYRPSEQA